MRWSHSPIETVPTYDMAVRRLRRQIQLGQLLPDERLPAERLLAGHLGVSRMTLREALRVLETEKLITIKRGAKGGAFVCSAEALDSIATAHLVRSPADTLRAMEFRLTLEPAAIRFATERRTPADLALIAGTLNRTEEAANRAIRYRNQVQFHIAVAGASHNRWMVEAITESIASLFLPCAPNASEAAIVDQDNQRQRILELIRFRDANGAATEISALLLSEYERILAKLHISGQVSA